jgi:DNA-binding transcriptional LysR family regulator
MFTVRTGHSMALLNDLRQGQLDLAIGLSVASSPEARLQWSEEPVWIRGPRIPFNQNDRIPLVSFGEECVFHRIAVEALQKCGRVHDTVYVSSSTTGLAAAISAGLGVMALARSRTGTPGLMIWEDGPLPKLPDVSCGIYIRDGGARQALEQLADAIAETLHPQTHLNLSERRPVPVQVSF